MTNTNLSFFKGQYLAIVCMYMRLLFIFPIKLFGILNKVLVGGGRRKAAAGEDYAVFFNCFLY